MRAWILFLLSALWAGRFAIADEPAPTELPCVAGSAFGHDYGSKRIDGIVRAVGNGIVARSKPQFEPFTEIDITVTENSRRIWTVDGIASFADDEAARSFFDSFLARLEAAMPSADKVVEPEEERVTFYTGVTKQCTQSFGQEKCYHVDGEKIILGRLERLIKPHAIYLSCGDITMEGTLLKELVP